jgi:hypothetical protein
MALQPFVGPWPLFSFLICYTVGSSPWTGISPPQDRYVNTQDNTKNKRTQTSTPRVGFEQTVSVFEREKTVHATDCAATVIGTTKQLQYTKKKLSTTKQLQYTKQKLSTTKQLQYTKQKLTKKCRIKFNDDFEVIQGHTNLCCHDYQRSHKKDVGNGVGPAR